MGVMLMVVVVPVLFMAVVVDKGEEEELANIASEDVAKLLVSLDNHIVSITTLTSPNMTNASNKFALHTSKNIPHIGNNFEELWTQTIVMPKC